MATSGADLLSNDSATGTQVRWSGGSGVLTAAGTFGGATLSLQYLAADQATWVNVDSTNGVLTANGAFGFRLPAGYIRAALTGGAPSAMYARVARLHHV
jgi:hypothetical protein